MNRLNNLLGADLSSDDDRSFVARGEPMGTVFHAQWWQSSYTEQNFAASQMPRLLQESSTKTRQPNPQTSSRQQALSDNVNNNDTSSLPSTSTIPLVELAIVLGGFCFVVSIIIALTMVVHHRHNDSDDDKTLPIQEEEEDNDSLPDVDCTV